MPLTLAAVLAMTLSANGQMVMAKMAQARGIQTMVLEGDVADASFYKDEILMSRLEAMLETIDVRRRNF